MDKKEGASGARQQKRAKVALLTGATTGLGKEITRILLQKGYEVRAIIQLHPDPEHGIHSASTGVKPYVVDIALDDDATRKTLLEASFGANVLFHMAAVSYNEGNSYEKLVSSNVIGTENVISAFMEANKASQDELRFVFSSSVSVYGYSRRGENLTEESELRPESNYSRTKMMAEEVIKSYSDSNPKIKYTILRLGTFYGPGYNRPFFKILRMMQEGKARYIGKGDNHLTLIGVEDAAAAIVSAAESPAGANRVFNVTDGGAHTIRGMFDTFAGLTGAKLPEKGISPLAARISRGIVGISYDEMEFLASDRIVSIESIRKEVGFNPRTSLNSVCKRIVEDFMKSHHTSTGV